MNREPQPRATANEMKKMEFEIGLKVPIWYYAKMRVEADTEEKAKRTAISDIDSADLNWSTKDESGIGEYDYESAKIESIKRRR